MTASATTGNRGLALALRALEPLDAARTRVLRGALAVAPLRWLLVRRDRRVAAIATLSVATALATTLLAPALVYVLGPVLLGVPHLASDARHLLLRPRLSRRLVVGVALGSAAILASRIAELASTSAFDFARVEIAVAAVGVAGAAVAGAARVSAEPGPRHRKRHRGDVVVAAAVLLGALGCARPEAARAAVVVSHNAIAVVLWVLLFRRRRTPALIPVAALCLATAFLLLWTVPRGLEATPGWQAFGFDLGGLAAAAGLGGRYARGAILATLLLQSVHYAIWLRCIPEDAYRAEGPPRWRTALRSWATDLRPTGLVVVAALAAAVPVAALARPSAVRDAYISLSSFHGYVEIAMLAFFLAAGAPPRAFGDAARGPQ